MNLLTHGWTMDITRSPCWQLPPFRRDPCPQSRGGPSTPSPASWPPTYRVSSRQSNTLRHHDAAGVMTQESTHEGCCCCIQRARCHICTQCESPHSRVSRQPIGTTHLDLRHQHRPFPLLLSEPDGQRLAGGPLLVEEPLEVVEPGEQPRPVGACG